MILIYKEIRIYKAISQTAIFLLSLTTCLILTNCTSTTPLSYLNKNNDFDLGNAVKQKINFLIISKGHKESMTPFGFAQYTYDFSNPVFEEYFKAAIDSSLFGRNKSILSINFITAPGGFSNFSATKGLSGYTFFFRITDIFLDNSHSYMTPQLAQSQNAQQMDFNFTFILDIYHEAECVATLKLSEKLEANGTGGQILFTAVMNAINLSLFNNRD